MRVPINLAREPFRRDRPMLVGSAVAAAVLLVTLAILVNLIAADRRAINDTRATLDRVNRQLSVMRAQQAKLDAQMRQPGNEAALDRTVLVNTLIKRKAVSWTRIFADLEKVTPENVRVLAIHPQVSSKDQVFLDMTVAADAPEAVIGFIVKLEGSDLFGSTAISSITPPSQTDPTFRYRLTVNYAQKL